MLLATLLVCLTVVCLALFALWYRATERILREKDARIDSLCTRLREATLRIVDLEGMLDTIRARDLNVPPPLSRQQEQKATFRVPLPPEIIDALEEIEDPSGDIEELARHRLELGDDAHAIAEEILA